MQASTRLPSLARHFGSSVVIANLSPAGWELVDDVSLVLSELANVALASTASAAVVSVLIHVDEIVVSLQVQAPGTSVEDVHVDEITVPLLDNATVDWGIRSIADGFEAWARLACDPGYCHGVACDRASREPAVTGGK
jgi:hypothetical protein